ncbi:MAG: hypothetical protein FWB73_08275, partial [Treponema sp.]|nr:hypothetical protein [Treponema sp.]
MGAELKAHRINSSNLITLFTLVIQVGYGYMKYNVVRNIKYDYTGQSYSSIYPNLHRYPASMIPQIGIDILKEYNISSG